MIADLIIGPNNILAGRVEIPAGTITKKSDGSSAETQIKFRSVTRNLIVDTNTTYDKTRVDDLKSISSLENSFSLDMSKTLDYFTFEEKKKMRIRKEPCC